MSSGVERESAGAGIDASGREAWRQAVAQMQRRLGLYDARRRYDELGEIAVGCTDFHLERDTSFTVGGPATFSLSMLLEGEITSCLAGGSPLVISAGSAVVFASEGPVSGTNSLKGGQRIRLVDMRFSRALLESAGGVPFSRFGRELYVDRSIPEAGTIFVTFSAEPKLAAVGARMLECSFGDDRARRIFMQAKALEALALTITALDRTPSTTCPLSEREQQCLIRARQLLHDRFDENWTIASLARAAGIGERRLKAGFRTFVGNSVHAYLRHVRLEAAAAMLTEGRLVTDVAMSVGFENLSHFSKSFREQFGQNPSAYSRSRVR